MFAKSFLRGNAARVPLEDFNSKAATFHEMIEALFDDHQYVFVWEHLELPSLSRRVLLSDGIHLNPHGQYCPYWSYRGAIFIGISAFQLA